MKEKLGHIEDKCEHSIMQLVVVPEGGNGDGGHGNNRKATE